MSAENEAPQQKTGNQDIMASGANIPYHPDPRSGLVRDNPLNPEINPLSPPAVPGSIPEIERPAPPPYYRPPINSDSPLASVVTPKVAETTSQTPISPLPPPPPPPQTPRSSPPSEFYYLKRGPKWEKVVAVFLVIFLLIGAAATAFATALYQNVTLPFLPQKLQDDLKMAVMIKAARLPIIREMPLGLLVGAAARVPDLDSANFDFQLKVSSQALNQGIVPLSNDLNLRFKGQWDRRRNGISGGVTINSGDLFTAEVDISCLTKDCYFNLKKAPTGIPFFDLTFLLDKWYKLPADFSAAGPGAGRLSFDRPKENPEVIYKGFEKGLRQSGIISRIKREEDEDLYGVKTSHLSLEITPDDLKVMAAEVYKAMAGDNLTAEEKKYFEEGLEKSAKSLSKLTVNLWLNAEEGWPQKLTASFRMSDLPAKTLNEFGFAGDLTSASFDLYFSLWEINKDKIIKAPEASEEFKINEVMDKIVKLPAFEEATPGANFLPPAPAGLEMYFVPEASPPSGVLGDQTSLLENWYDFLRSEITP